ncbi:MAG: hypothetical protein ABGZ35_17060, partial [Planctomycetaceae bacterium]
FLLKRLRIEMTVSVNESWDHRAIFEMSWRVLARGGPWMMGSGTPAVATNQRNTFEECRYLT